MTTKLSKDNSLNVTDEVFNTASHLVGCIFALLGGTYLIVQSAVLGDVYKIIGFSIYAFTLVFMFLASTLMHGLTGRVSKVFLVLDYVSVFLLIAGTLTPLLLIVLRNHVGWTIFGVVWFVSLVGISLRSTIHSLPKWVTNTFFVALGWVGAIVGIALYGVLPLFAIVLLALGGIVYTVGSFIFYFEKPNFLPGKFGFHEVWHIFVLIAAFLHWYMMYAYVLGY
jgi:hemolysin III